MPSAPDLDRQIVALALPALGALAAEPLYLLADTAIVGHIGTRELAALSLAAAALSAVTGLCNFLAYATTALVARLHGAGEDVGAAALAPQAGWLALGLGVVLGGACAALAGPLMALLGGAGATAHLAARYLRIAAIGLPMALLALAGQGHLRGMGDLRSPLVVLVAANLANVLLEAVLVYGLGLALDGSALGTVVAQLGMGAAFAVLLLRAAGGAPLRPRPALLRRLAAVGGAIAVRTAALLGSFTLASAVLARDSAPALAAHQIAFGLFVLLALVLDALAIAGQVLVGRALGAGDAAGARAAGRRLLWLSLWVGIAMGAVLLATTRLVPALFTPDDAVRDQAAELWPLFAALMVPGALVFALDGVLIGAQDTRFIAGAMALAAACFVPLCLLSGARGWGVVGVWAALHVLMGVRLATMAWRFRGTAWARVGATA